LQILQVPWVKNVVVVVATGDDVVVVGVVVVVATGDDVVVVGVVVVVGSDGLMVIWNILGGQPWHTRRQTPKYFLPLTF